MAARTTKKATGTAVAQWDEELAKMAQAARGLEDSVSGGNFISTRGGKFTYNGAEVPGGKMRVVVVNHILENHYYNVRFDPDNPASPACFAFGTEEDDMAPHEKSTEPQHDACKGCPMNQWNSADTGRGKACANIRRLALIPEDGLDDIDAAALAFLKVPVTSVKAWAGYVRQIADTLARPPLGVVTEVSIEPDAKTQFKLSFKLVQKIEDSEAIRALIAKSKQAETELVVPYSPMEEEATPPARGRGAKYAKPEPKKPARGGRR